MRELSNDKLKQLLRATAQGDGKAFKSFYEATSPKLLAVALTMMRDSALAEDVLQEAFVQVWHRAAEFHADRGSVLTWLTTIVRYRAIDMLRKLRRSGSSRGKSIDVDPTDMDFLQQKDADNDSANIGPLASAISSEENTHVHECVDRLSDNQQKSVALAFFRGFTHQELADCLLEPLGTIKSRLRRSLLRLKECLETLEDSIELHSKSS
jgi:RNA polymerase sigma-70 factor (ECF subfamily)